MHLKEEIRLNQYGQELVDPEELLAQFRELNPEQRRAYLSALMELTIQSKPKEEDIEAAILDSGLKPTYTPCVLLKKGVAPHQLKKIIDLPDAEVEKVFRLLISMFKIAYQRRFQEEKDHAHKWWYWDLSDAKKLELIR